MNYARSISPIGEAVPKVATMQYEYILSGFYQISGDLGEDGTLEDILGRKP